MHDGGPLDLSPRRWFTALVDGEAVFTRGEPARSAQCATNAARELHVAWARLDSNQGATDYESAALTAELRARSRVSVAPVPVPQRRSSDDCHNVVR